SSVRGAVTGDGIGRAGEASSSEVRAGAAAGAADCDGASFAAGACAGAAESSARGSHFLRAMGVAHLVGDTSGSRGSPFLPHPISAARGGRGRGGPVDLPPKIFARRRAQTRFGGGQTSAFFPVFPAPPRSPMLAVIGASEVGRTCYPI